MGVKHCPLCKRNYDDSWRLCLHDGSFLVEGVSATGVPKVRELKGAGGWLGLYVWTILILWPLGLLGGMTPMGGYQDVESLVEGRFASVGEEFGGMDETLEALAEMEQSTKTFLRVFLHLSSYARGFQALNAAWMIVEIFSAFALLRVLPWAARFVKKVILIRVCFFIIVFLFTVPLMLEIMRADAGPGASWALGAHAGLFIHNVLLELLIILYFMRSRRVRNTSPP